jgi:DNA mismatch repair protein MutS2
MITDKTLRTLEYPKVLERLAQNTSFSLAREAALALRPVVELGAVRELQQQTEECARLLDTGSDVALGGAHDIRPGVTRAGLGGALDPLQLLDVQSTLECAERIARTLGRLDEGYPWLLSQRHRMGHFRGIINAIDGAINDRGDVVDTASPALQRIRSELRVAHNRLVDRLNGMLGAYGNAVQDAVVTTRNGRYVIPIKAEFKGQVKGIVHDQSASGATLFIEPLGVTELNNTWHQLQLDERDEVERILRELSARIGQESAAILSTVEALGAVDLVLAKARYGALTRATTPALNGEGCVTLVGARHPLLSGTVVPTDITLGDEFRALLITGPNTGGKTVALKTVGLLTLMAQTGLLVPAEAGSELAVFDAIYADIGDEQSIEQSLSTFSSHLTNIISMLEGLRDNTLLLLDELGAGTDPTEGSALARAILTYLLERDVRVIATTHYSELKAFAYEEPGVENASVEFDVETLSPTYRLSIGLPGRSNALAIARRLGLGEDVLARASSYLTGEERRVETMLAEIQEEREETAELYARANEAARRAEAARDRLQQELERILDEREGIIAAARAEADESVRALRGQFDRIEAELRTSTITPQVSLAALTERLEGAVKSAELLQPTPKRERAPKPVAAATAAPARDLVVGDEVEVARLGQRGTITSATPGRDEVEVQVGALRMRARRADLRLAAGGQGQGDVSERERRAPVGAGVSMSVGARSDTPATRIEVDMRGWRADDVPPELDRYLHDAYMSNMPFVRIIHGKGTGALRQVVRDELSTNPLVSSFHTAPQQEGGDGVTVVELSKT